MLDGWAGAVGGWRAGAVDGWAGAVARAHILRVVVTEVGSERGADASKMKGWTGSLQNSKTQRAMLAILRTLVELRSPASSTCARGGRRRMRCCR